MRKIDTIQGLVYFYRMCGETTFGAIHLIAKQIKQELKDERNAYHLRHPVTEPRRDPTHRSEINWQQRIQRHERTLAQRGNPDSLRLGTEKIAGVTFWGQDARLDYYHPDSDSNSDSNSEEPQAQVSDRHLDDREVTGQEELDSGTRDCRTH